MDNKKISSKQFRKIFGIKSLIASFSLITLCLVIGLYVHNDYTVSALDNNFANGITVDSDGDGADSNPGDSICDDGVGNCTLRAALEESNLEPGTQTIEFNITGPSSNFSNGGQSGYTIQPNSALPFISDTVIIDGYSQPGSLANTAIAPNPLNGRLLIQLDGTNAGGTGSFSHPSNVAGLNFLNGSASSELKGLIINKFTGPGVVVSGGVDNFKLSGNYIGTDYTGLINKGNNGIGITILGPTSTSGGPANGSIGGSLPSERNIISGNDTTDVDPNLVIGSQGISITSESPGWEIKGNYIGIGADGLTAIPNELGGITVDFVRDLTIGGPNVGDANVFSGNGDGGIQPDGCDNIVIQGNFIGTDYSGTISVPNQRKGISFLGSVNSIIGGTNAGEGNVIANAGNGDPGVFLNSGHTILGPISHPSDISILGNRIVNNGGLGIDLNFNGPTVNDSLDPDTGSNDLLNYPEYTSVVESGGDTTVAYRLDVPAGDYRIEFFSNTAADGSGFGEGETYLGSQNISHPGGGLSYFTHTLTGVTGVTNLAMTTTERNVATPSGFGSTSEFSPNTVGNPIGDLSLTKTLVNPEDVAIGATLTYQFTITNNGPEPIDLSSYNGSSLGNNTLINDIMPTDITYSGNVSSSDVTCFSGGVGSAIMFGPILANHSDHEIVFCSWSGAPQQLGVGNSFSFNFDVVVQPGSDLVFNNYATVPPGPTQDPDLAAFGAIFGSGQDMLDQLTTSGINNFSYAQYPLPVVPSVNTSNTNNINSLLKTGSGAIAIVVASLLIVTLAGLGVWFGRVRLKANT